MSSLESLDSSVGGNPISIGSSRLAAGLKPNRGEKRATTKYIDLQKHLRRRQKSKTSLEGSKSGTKGERSRHSHSVEDNIGQQNEYMSIQSTNEVKSTERLPEIQGYGSRESSAEKKQAQDGRHTSFERSANSLEKLDNKSSEVQIT